MKTSILLCLGVVATSMLAVAGQEPARLSGAELDALLVRIEKAFSKIRTLETSFVQEKHLAIFTDAPKSEGVCLFARPDRVRIEIRKPFQSALIANGKSVAKYECLASRWKKLDLGNPDAVLLVTGQIAAWLEGRFRDKDSIYDISATVGEGVTLYLTPKREKMRSFLKSVELEIPADFSGIASITLREPGADYTKLIFREPQQNVAVPDAVFDTTLPAPAPWPVASAAGPAAGRSDKDAKDIQETEKCK